MSAQRPIEVTHEPRGVVRLTLDRADKKNAMDGAMMDALHEFADGMGGTGDVRAVVLSGRGGTFCAGGDLGWMMSQIEADRATRVREAHRLAGMLRALNEMPVPLIGHIEGVAMGGGIGLACVCDVAVAAAGTRFGFTETRLGIIPATIAPYVIARMGEGRARRVFMSARIFDAAEAADLGIVSAAVHPTDLDAAVEAEIAPYLDVVPEAAGRAKRLARSLGPRIDDGVIEDTVARLADAWESPAARAGIAAFLERRRG